MKYSFEALGTCWWIEIFGTTEPQKLEYATCLILDCCNSFNNAYSRFRVDSYISTLNRDRILKNPTSDLTTLIQKGQELYTATHGACNMLVGHILDARGYNPDYSFIPHETHTAEKPGDPLSDIDITPACITLKNGNIDLGGYGKGYLIDHLARVLITHDIPYFLINGGGDMYGTSDEGEPITIFLEHPEDPSCAIAETKLFNGGFAASSMYKRQWTYRDTTYHHIVGVENPSITAGFVKAETAVEADAHAKCCLLFEENELMKMCARTNVAYARFKPSTQELWYTKNFELTLI